MSDALRDALRDLNDAALPQIKAPGVEAARRTLRRRRATRATVAASLACTLAVLAFVLPAPWHRPPVISPTASASPTGTPPSPSATPVPSTASSSPPGTASPGAGSGATAGAGGGGGCRHKGYVAVNYSSSGTETQGQVVNLSADEPGQTYTRICPDETIRVFWVTYQAQPDGSQKLYDYAVYILTPKNPRVRAVVKSPTVCPGATAYVSGSYAIRQTIPAGVEFGYPSYSEQRKGGQLAGGGNPGACTPPSPSPS
jgi:hypothetical protein